ncbi:MAG TPA: hypothetical protein DCR55_01435 [Lentisphaeria bacterium]|nr:hypothetical protein [Lentisphaeria bacterium]
MTETVLEDRPLTADPLWFLGISVGLIALFVTAVSIFTEQQWMIDYRTADVTSGLMRMLGLEASSEGRKVVLIWNDVTRNANVEYGCNGLLMYLLLTATMLPFPVSWRERALGLLGGLLFAFTINQIRLVALMFLLFWVDAARFEIYHTGFGQAFSVLSVASYWWIWLKFRGSANSAPPADVQSDEVPDAG